MSVRRRGDTESCVKNSDRHQEPDTGENSITWLLSVNIDFRIDRVSGDLTSTPSSASDLLSGLGQVP